MLLQTAGSQMYKEEFSRCLVFCAYTQQGQDRVPVTMDNSSSCSTAISSTLSVYLIVSFQLPGDEKALSCRA